MGTLTHRALLQYIESNDLPGLKTFLDTRHLPVDDRDEVSGRFSEIFSIFFSPIPFFFLTLFLEWPNSTYGCIGKGPIAVCS